MSSYTYNPFNKELKEITVKDLQILKSISEGWYIEYKSQPIGARASAKSIAAFANHYGGWLFFGVKQKDDGSNYVDSFPGLNQAETIAVIEDIRNGVKDCLFPSPYYDFKILSGPNDAIGLQEGKSIIVIYIPQGNDSPYIHISGRIFRRVADSSDPKFETDRFIVDQLSQRRKKTDQAINEFLETESNDYKELTNIEIFFFLDPLLYRNNLINLSFEEFILFMRNNIGTAIELKFDNFFTLNNGYIARQIYDNNPHGPLLSWKFYRNGWCVITVPCSTYKIDELKFIPKLAKYNFLDEFSSVVNTINMKSDSLCIDVNNIIAVLIGIVSRYERLITISEVSGPIFFKLVFHNFKNKIPFLDTKTYITHIKDLGFPFLQTNEIRYPIENGLYGLDKLFDEDTNIDDTKDKKYKKIYQGAIHATRLIINASYCLGLSTRTAFPLYDSWLLAAYRAEQ